MSQSGPLLVANLELHGIAAADIARVTAAGYYKLSPWCSPPQEAAKIKGVGDQKAERIQAEAMRLVPSRSTTATEMHIRRSQIIQVQGAQQAPPRQLRDQLHHRALWRVKTGKSQLCHTLAVTCQLPIENGGAEG